MLVDSSNITLSVSCIARITKKPGRHNSVNISLKISIDHPFIVYTAPMEST